MGAPFQERLSAWDVVNSDPLGSGCPITVCRGHPFLTVRELGVLVVEWAGDPWVTYPNNAALVEGLRTLLSRRG